MKHKISTGIIVLVIIGSLGSAMGGNKATKVGEIATTNSTSSSSDSKDSDSKTFKIGDVIQLKNYKITVNKVYTVQGDNYAKPKDGNEFLAIDCTVENISKEEQAISSFDIFRRVFCVHTCKEKNLLRLKFTIGFFIT